MAIAILVSSAEDGSNRMLYKIHICCFSGKHATTTGTPRVRIRCPGWAACLRVDCCLSGMSTCGLLFERHVYVWTVVWAACLRVDCCLSGMSTCGLLFERHVYVSWLSGCFSGVLILNVPVASVLVKNKADIIISSC
jgi:hypothetical protein